MGGIWLVLMRFSEGAQAKFASGNFAAVVAVVDHSGTRSTGRQQGDLSVSVDNPLGLNDLFNVGYSQDLDVMAGRLRSYKQTVQAVYIQIPRCYASAVSCIPMGPATAAIPLARLAIRACSPAVGAAVLEPIRFGFG